MFFTQGVENDVYKGLEEEVKRDVQREERERFKAIRYYYYFCLLTAQPLLIHFSPIKERDKKER
jgi:hypothetical protein